MKWIRMFWNMLRRNWREKLVALLFAFVFWYLIKGQADRDSFRIRLENFRQTLPTGL